MVHAIFSIPIVPNITIETDTPVTDILNAMLTTSVFYTSMVSVVIVINLAILNNHGIIYAAARKLKLTYRSSNADVWQDTFYKYEGYWICIRFSDGRSLIGWPRYYSPAGKPKELFVADATWWRPDLTGNPTTTDVIGPGVYISDFDDIVAIELLE